MLRSAQAAIAATLLLAGCATPSSNRVKTDEQATAARPLKIASWNLEFLAERDGAGCEPRHASDYAAMREMANGLDADVIAFQEAENEAAAARVFDPAKYAIVMEKRPGNPSGSCGGRQPQQAFIRQAVGFAIRKDLPFERHPDVVSLTLGNPQLRSGVDITVRPAGGRPLRLLSIHLKSGCFSGAASGACSALLRQIPVLESWIDAAALGQDRFVVAGDWNRRLAAAGDPVWADINDGEPANSELRLADAGVKPRCDPRYDAFIDHIVLDRRASADMRSFVETTYPPQGRHLSDHCPVAVTLAR